jgi:hypothetical protein
MLLHTINAFSQASVAGTHARGPVVCCPVQLNPTSSVNVVQARAS